MTTFFSTYRTAVVAISCLLTDECCLSLLILLPHGYVACKSVLAEFSANTTLLVATEWKLVVEGVVGVDPDGTSLESI